MLGKSPEDTWAYVVGKLDELFVSVDSITTCEPEHISKPTNTAVKIPLMEKETPEATLLMNKVKNTVGKGQRKKRLPKWHDITRQTHSAHLGHWRKSARKTYKTKDTRHPAAVTYIYQSRRYTKVSKVPCCCLTYLFCPFT